MTSPATEKQALRTAGRERMRALSDERRESGSRAACQRLLNLPEVKAAKVAMVFSSLPDEPIILPLVQALKDNGVKLCLPRQLPHGPLEPALIESWPTGLMEELFGGTRALLHPPASWPALKKSDVGLVVLPGLAFDALAHRIGRGGGFYDRFLASPDLNAFKVGLALDEQIISSVPMEEHDEPLDAVVTDSTVYARA